MHPSSGAASVVNGVDYYKWDSPSGDFSILLRLELVDGLLSEVISAFGAVPKRGAETGGILLGQVDGGASTVVQIDGFEPVPCSYQRGPSYLLSESDLTAFDAAVRKHSGAPNGMATVGYYRSHTRNRESLSDEDRSLMARFFPAPNGVMLVIQPRVTRPSTAGLLAYRNGEFGDWPAAQFPFSRRELDGGSVAARPLPRRPEPVATRDFSLAGYAEADKPPARARRKGIWPAVLAGVLSFLLGVGAGVAGRPLVPALNTPDHDPFVLSLSARRTGGGLLINWDRDAPPVRYAQRGALQITDGQFTKTLELTASELQTGTIVFHNSSEHVSLRLEIFVHQLSKIADSIEWEYVPPR